MVVAVSKIKHHTHTCETLTRKTVGFAIPVLFSKHAQIGTEIISKKDQSILNEQQCPLSMEIISKEDWSIHSWQNAQLSRRISSK